MQRYLKIFVRNKISKIRKKLNANLLVLLSDIFILRYYKLDFSKILTYCRINVAEMDTL